MAAIDLHHVARVFWSAAPPPMQCANCAHFHAEHAPGPPGVSDGGTLKCDAFPDGIPEGIQSGAFDHTRPHPGDHGTRYEAARTHG